MAERARRAPIETKAGKAVANLEAIRLAQADPARSVDRFLKLSGLALAVVCGLLPWAAYLQNARGTQVAATAAKTIRDPLDRSHQRRVISAVTNADLAAIGVDPDTTGTTSTAGASGEAARPDDARKQPFPPRPQFVLRDVVGGMGMIEDQSGFWFVEKGSLLPDASRVAAISQSDGVWQITTDKGRVIRQTQ